jgi:5-formyltetrahydrofolate cyclo-ligase
MPQMARAVRIGAYSAVGGEVDCAPALAVARRRTKAVFLPVLHGGRLRFAPCSPATPMLRNRFGIAEPATGPARWQRGMDLDVVLVPLVAFDPAGHRLGMGGGFYDRSFAFLRRRGRWRRPWLVGLAHEFQHVEFIPAQPWDVPLHAVVTEGGVRYFESTRHCSASIELGAG